MLVSVIRAAVRRQSAHVGLQPLLHHKSFLRQQQRLVSSTLFCSAAATTTTTSSSSPPHRPPQLAGRQIRNLTVSSAPTPQAQTEAVSNQPVPPADTTPVPNPLSSSSSSSNDGTNANNIISNIGNSATIIEGFPEQILSKDTEGHSLRRFRAIEGRMEEFTHFFHASTATLKILGWCMLALMVLTALFWSHIKDWLGHTGADIGRKSLAEEDLLREATDSLKRVTTDALKNPEMVDEVLALLRTSIVENPEAHRLIVQFLTQTLADPETQQVASGFVHNLLTRLLADPTFKQNSVQFLRTLLQDESFQASAVDLVKYVISTKSTQLAFLDLLKYVFTEPTLRDQYVVPFVKGVVEDKWVYDQVTDVLLRASHNVLADDAIKQHSIDFVKTVIDDPQLHQEGSTALWHVVKQTFTPKWFASSESSSSSSSSSSSTTQKQIRFGEPAEFSSPSSSRIGDAAAENSVHAIPGSNITDEVEAIVGNVAGD